ncbi:RNA-binding protein, predicted [Methanocaldococcus infernus ME]|uniref:RNA-binding protein, predicted n=1 Tax=Methanocaldococcus infernus (strain DSM 11812 / JCM 15783 / ME) TaxID=573063 RepID=D5VRA1_METIM|nr:CooT family nickel-binding protein [Methanocaldococcus infernus]ADG13104.1 RNA-binding protein, predicted [Methanocaldococcus infernus ME]
MCNFNLYYNGELVMEDVMLVEKLEEKVIAINLFGEKKELKGEIKKIDVNNNEIIVEG